MIKEEKIIGLIEEKFAGTDKFLVSVKVKPGNVIRIYIDGDKGVTISDCAELSRYIESKLNRESEDFELEVSSAGLTQPLVLLRQYQKNIGQSVKVTFKDGKVVTGVLKIAGTESFVVVETKIIKKPKSTEEIEHEIFYNQIKETKIVIKFNS